MWKWYESQISVSIKTQAHLFPYYLWPLSSNNGRMESCDRDLSGLQSPKYLLFGPSRKKFASPWCPPMTGEISWTFCFTSWLLIINSKSRDENGRWEEKRTLSISEIKFPASWMEWGLSVIPTLILCKENKAMCSFLTHSGLCYKLIPIRLYLRCLPGKYFLFDNHGLCFTDPVLEVTPTCLVYLQVSKS